MAKKLSDINLHSDRRKTEKIYERALSGGEGSIEASKQLEKPRFKSFLKDIIDKRNAGVGRGGALVKDPEPEIIKEELTKTSEKLQDILRIKRSNQRLRSKLEDTKRIKRPGDTPVKRKMGLGKLASAVVAPAFDLMGVLGTLAKIGILQWLSDPANMQVLQNLVKILGGVIKLFGTSFENIGQGWLKLTEGGTLVERLAGFFELLTGLTLMKWLVNPKSMLKDFPRIFKAIKNLPKLFKGMMGKNAKQFEKEAIKKVLKASLEKTQALIGSIRKATKRAFIKIFGRHAAKLVKAITQRIQKKLAKSAVTGALGIGKAATKKLMRNFAKVGQKWFSKIPGLGLIIDMFIRTVIFKEPVKEAAFKSAGGQIGMLLAGFIGSAVPFFGTMVGGFLGYLAGEWLGSWLYDRIFGSGKYNPESEGHITQKNTRAWWDFLGWAGTGKNKEENKNDSEENKADINKGNVSGSEVNDLSKKNAINKKINNNKKANFVASTVISNNTSNNIAVSTVEKPPINNSSENELQEAAV